MAWTGKALVACVLLAGCGAPERLAEAERAQARETLRAYAAAMVRRDGDGACRTLTRAMRARHDRRHGSCARHLPVQARALEFDEPVTVAVTRDLRDDGSAHAIVRYTSGAGFSGAEVILRREAGRWLIDEDLGCITSGCDP